MLGCKKSEMKLGSNLWLTFYGQVELNIEPNFKIFTSSCLNIKLEFCPYNR